MDDSGGVLTEEERPAAVKVLAKDSEWYGATDERHEVDPGVLVLDRDVWVRKLARARVRPVCVRQHDVGRAEVRPLRRDAGDVEEGLEESGPVPGLLQEHPRRAR